MNAAADKEMKAAADKEMKAAADKAAIETAAAAQVSCACTCIDLFVTYSPSFTYTPHLGHILRV